MIKHGMILAAGIGKRMQPLTLKTPKPLLEINNSSLIERAINLLINYGVQEISINVHYLPDQITTYISKKNFNVELNNCGNLRWVSRFSVLKYLNSTKRY